MNLQRCLRILELETATSAKEIQQAYRDLVHVWHPDRFQSNPRLRQKAEDKLREINQAYAELRTYLVSSKGKGLKGVTTGLRGDPSRDLAGSSTCPAPKRSSIGRYLLCLVLCIILGISALIVYLLSNMDTIASKTKGLASEALKEIVTKLEENKTIQKNDPSMQRIIKDIDRESTPKETKASFELHLDSGSIIVTESWWEENDMLMYKTSGGSMGIEKNKVKKIVER
jgi:sensor domain CHASE-containing protein